MGTKLGLSAVRRKGALVGWNVRLGGRKVWVCSARQAPTPEEADRYYLAHGAELLAGVEASAPALVDAADVTLRDVADLFTDRKERAGIAARSLDEYQSAIQDFLDAAGSGRRPSDLTPADFAAARAAWAKRFGPDRLAKFIVMVRSMLKWASGAPLRLPPPDYGDEFDVPARREFRLSRKAHRDEHGAKEFTRAEVGVLLAAADVTRRAMILLALNAGYGNTDVAALPLSVLDLGGGWLDYARGKTGIDRRAPLWPETVAALRAELVKRERWQQSRVKRGRPRRDGADGLVFLTRMGGPYVLSRPGGKGNLLHKDQVAYQFGRLCNACGLARHGRNFYSLRRTFATLADEMADPLAKNAIMGHVAEDVPSLYVQHVADSRLKRITDHVHAALLGPTTDTAAAPTGVSPPEG